MSPENPSLEVIDGVLFSKQDKRLVCYPYIYTDSEYIIPQGITTIGAWAFSGGRDLTGIKIPDSVTSIDSSAFYGCTGLTSINVSENNAVFNRFN